MSGVRPNIRGTAWWILQWARQANRGRPNRPGKPASDIIPRTNLRGSGSKKASIVTPETGSAIKARTVHARKGCADGGGGFLRCGAEEKNPRRSPERSGGAGTEKRPIQPRKLPQQQ